MAEIANAHFSGFLIELPDDLDNNVIDHAVYTAGRMQDQRLLTTRVSKPANPSLQSACSLALREYGESALYDLDTGLSSPATGRQEKLLIIDVVREIGGVRGKKLLLLHINDESPELQHQIYVALATLHYQSDPDDQYIFGHKIEEEVQVVTALLAGMEDLYEVEEYALVHAALGNELDVRRDNMLLLISFLYPSIVMLDTRANIDLKVSEVRTFALEVLDNLLTADIKQIVLPLLDDLTVAERLEELFSKFPQDQLSLQERLMRSWKPTLTPRFTGPKVACCI